MRSSNADSFLLFVCNQLLAIDHKLLPGVYRCTFDTKAYYAAKGEQCFYPEVPIIFVSSLACCPASYSFASWHDVAHPCTRSEFDGEVSSRVCRRSKRSTNTITSRCSSAISVSAPTVAAEVRFCQAGQRLCA
eukprot:2085730-Rhodomonas_salina.1